MKRRGEASASTRKEQQFDDETAAPHQSVIRPGFGKRALRRSLILLKKDVAECFLGWAQMNFRQIQFQPLYRFP